jgi:hypothetical protein
MPLPEITVNKNSALQKIPLKDTKNGTLIA